MKGAHSLLPQGCCHTEFTCISLKLVHSRHIFYVLSPTYYCSSLTQMRKDRELEDLDVNLSSTSYYFIWYSISLRLRDGFNSLRCTVGVFKAHILSYMTGTSVRLKLAVGQRHERRRSSVDWILRSGAEPGTKNIGLAKGVVEGVS